MEKASKNPRKQKQKEAKLKAQQSGLATSSGQPATSSTAQSIQSATSSAQSLETATKCLEISSSGDQPSNSSKSLVDAIQFAPKKVGKDGNPCELKSNFFLIKFKKYQDYYHYNINILDTKEPTNQKKKDPASKKIPKRINQLVFESLFANNEYKSIFQGSILPAFDGEKNMYALNPFNLTNGTWSSVVRVSDNGEQKEFQVEVTTPEESHYQNFKSLLRTRDVMPFQLQALDIVMRNGPRLMKTALGPNLFLKSNDPKANTFKIDVMKYGMFGVYQCAKLGENGQVFYNVDQSIAVFNHGGDLLESINAILKEYKIQDFNLFDKQVKAIVEGHLKNMKFQPLHLAYKRNKTFMCFSTNSISKTQFEIEKEDGKKMTTSVKAYFEEMYPNFAQKRRINQSWPCVQAVSSGKPIYYPIEWCQLLSDEVYRGKLNIKQQAETTKASSKSPVERFNTIINHVRSLEGDSVLKTSNGNVNYLKEFGVEISTDPVKVQGRTLKAPVLQYGNQELDTKNTGTWMMKGLKYLEPSKIGDKWAIFNFNNLRGKQVIGNDKVYALIQGLIKEARNNGVYLKAPADADVKYNFIYTQNNLEKDIDFKKYVTMDYKLLFFIIPPDEFVYNEIKSVAELKYGLITQCSNQEKPYWKAKYGQSFSLAPQLLANFFLKINPKTNGTNHSLKEIEKTPILKKEGTMIMGIDVTHPAVVNGFSKSVAAVVASYNKNYDKCFHKLVVQKEAKKEMVDLKPISNFLLSEYKKKNQQLPKSIIVFRDGVGEGDFAKVKDRELGGIRAAYKEVSGKDDVKITFIMVQKRHNTRFMPEGVKANDRDQNIKAGTVVDTEITNHKFFEYYLCSHAGAKGTSRPTKYLVLIDENKLDADEIQKTTYQLCYLYPRSSKALSIPPHAHYAHLLAKRARSYLCHAGKNKDEGALSENQTRKLNEQIEVKKNLNGRLFFI